MRKRRLASLFLKIIKFSKLIVPPNRLSKNTINNSEGTDHFKYISCGKNWN